MEQQLALIRAEDEKARDVLQRLVWVASGRMGDLASRRIACPAFYDDGRFLDFLANIDPAVIIVQGEDPSTVIAALELVKTRNQRIMVLMMTREPSVMEYHLDMFLRDGDNYWLAILGLKDGTGLINKLLAALLPMD